MSAPARPTPVGPAPWGRIAAGTAAVVVLAAVTVAAVRVRPDGPGGSVLAAVAGVVLVPIVASVLEWFVHRFVYHEAVVPPLRAIFTVHTAHHYAWFPTWRYVTGGPARRLAIRRRAPEVHRSAVRNAVVRLAHSSWYLAIGAMVIWGPAWLLTGDVAFLAGIVVSSVLVSNLFIVVHDTIHRPGSHRIVEARFWFPFLDRHHFIHHVDLGANLNFLLPLADALYGTLRTTLTAQELAQHGTLAEAKARPIGQGERAHAALAVR